METQTEVKPAEQESYPRSTAETTVKPDHPHNPGNPFPWYFHALWVCFWIVALWYLFTYQLPIVEQEFVSPR